MASTQHGRSRTEAGATATSRCCWVRHEHFET